MSENENNSNNPWPSPQPTTENTEQTSAPTTPTPTDNQAAPTAIADQPKSKFKLPIKAIGIAVLVILVAGIVLQVAGGSDNSAESNTQLIAFEYRNNDSYDLFMASVKKDEVVTDTRIGDDNMNGIRYYSSLNSLTSNYIPFVKDGDTIFTWGEEDDDKELTAINTKDGTTTSLFRGSDISYVDYIADEKTFLVSDDGSCFSAAEDRPSTRLGYGYCYIKNGNVITSKAEQNEVSINVTNIDGTESKRTSYPLTSDSWSLRNNGRLITGYTENGIFEVYSLATGKRILAAAENETITVLSESSESSNLLIAVENAELDNATIDVGVVVSAEGGGTYTKISSPYSASGILSPQGDEFVLISKKTQDSETVSITRHKLSDKSETEIATADSIEETWNDDFGRLAIVTDSEVISGNFEDGFQPSVNASFDDESSVSMYSSANSNGIYLRLSDDGKQDLYFIKDGQADGRSRSYVTLVTGGSGINIVETSLAIGGSIVYSETSNDYVEIFKQKIAKDSQRVKVAEGRITSFQVMSSNEYYYYESDDDAVTMYHQKGEKPNDRKTISTRYILSRVVLGENPNALVSGTSNEGNTATAVIDNDLRSCRESGAPVLTLGETHTFTFTRSQYDTVYDNEKSTFCVTGTGSRTIAYVSSFVSNFGSSEGVQVEIQCQDGESGWTEGESYWNRVDSNLRTDIDIPSDTGTYSCSVWDDTYYSYSDTGMGAQITIGIKEP